MLVRYIIARSAWNKPAGEQQFFAGFECGAIPSRMRMQWSDERAAVYDMRPFAEHTKSELEERFGQTGLVILEAKIELSKS